MEKIVIVGGGTAGWMAAIAISSHFPDKRVTVIEPASGSPIGVGESVTGSVLRFVRYPFHELSTEEFFRNCDATLKLGIRFQDWSGEGTEYLSPIDYPPEYFRHHYYEDLEDFYALLVSKGKRLGEDQLHGLLMRANRTDFFRMNGKVSGDFSTASCHLDARKFAAWLRKAAVARANVTHLDDEIEGPEMDGESGLVKWINTKNGNLVEGDFFLDCTGFHRLVFGQAYSPAWIDYSDFIRVDRAVVSFAPHPEGEDMPVYTLARALRHGWMWEIPTQSRLGRGYVFSSKHASDEEVISELRELRLLSEKEDPRVIPFRPGKFATQWEGNVCAIGLAGGFLEPLESTTIHMMDVQIKALTELFLPFFSRTSAPALSRKYNALIETMYEDFVDFVSFHYRTGRSDTTFWREYQEEEALTDRNRIRLETWRHAFPSREDFPGVQTDRFILTAGLLVWGPMLCGLGLLQPDHAQTVLQRTKAEIPSADNLARYMKIRDTIAAGALSQEETVRFLRGDR